jgi:hypothetical protein
MVYDRQRYALNDNMVGDDLTAHGKRIVADRAFPVLLDDLSVEQFPHLCRGPEFAISPRVVRVFDALNTKVKSAFFPRLIPTAAEE